MSTKTYVSPGVYNELVDDSNFTPTPAIGGFASIQYIFSDKGEDNKIVRVNSQLEAINTFGQPNPVKYNDLGYGSALNWLAGGLSSYVCRLTAPDSVKAVIDVTIKSIAVPTKPTDARIKFYEAGKAFTAGDILIDTDGGINFHLVTADIALYEEKRKHDADKTQEIYEVKRATAYDQLTDVITANVSIGDVVFEYETADEDSFIISSVDDVIGVKTYVVIDTFDAPSKFLSAASLENGVAPVSPAISIGAFKASGSGASYNGMYINLSADETKTSENGGTETLQFDLFEYNDNGDAVQLSDETGSGTFAAEKNLYGRSVTMTDAVARFAKSVIYEDKSALAIQADIDTLLGLVDGVYVKTGETDVLQLMRLGITRELTGKRLILSGGDDGSLVVNNAVDTVVKDGLILDFFIGTIDEAILTRDNCPGSFIFDMQQNPTLSTAMAEFCKVTRPDVFAYHAGQDDVNPEETLDYSKKIFNISSRNSSLRTGYCNQIDPFTGSNLRVPIFYTSKIRDLATSINFNGIDFIHAGFDGEGLISGFDADSVNYSPSKPYQDLLYTNKVNPAIKDGSGEYFYLSTRTRQKKDSKLSNEVIVQINQVMAIENEILGRRFIDKFITNDLLKEIKNTYFEHYLNKWQPSPAIKTFTVDVMATEYDRQNNTAKVFVTVTFNNILEKLVITHIVK